jgi:hypothetical protein
MFVGLTLVGLIGTGVVNCSLRTTGNCVTTVASPALRSESIDALNAKVETGVASRVDARHASAKGVPRSHVHADAAIEVARHRQVSESLPSRSSVERPTSSYLLVSWVPDFGYYQHAHTWFLKAKKQTDKKLAASLLFACNAKATGMICKCDR